MSVTNRNKIESHLFSGEWKVCIHFIPQIYYAPRCVDIYPNFPPCQFNQGMKRKVSLQSIFLSSRKKEDGQNRKETRFFFFWFTTRNLCMIASNIPVLSRNSLVCDAPLDIFLRWLLCPMSVCRTKLCSCSFSTRLFIYLLVLWNTIRTVHTEPSDQQIRSKYIYLKKKIKQSFGEHNNISILMTSSIQ